MVFLIPFQRIIALAPMSISLDYLAFNPIQAGLFRTLVRPGGGHFCPRAITHDRHKLETSNLVWR